MNSTPTIPCFAYFPMVCLSDLLESARSSPHRRSGKNERSAIWSKRTVIGWRIGFAMSVAWMLLAGVTNAEIHTYAATNTWQVMVGYHNESAPALDHHGNIYVTTVDGKLFSLTPEGVTRWHYDFEFESVSTPAIGDDGTIYLGCRNRRLYAVDDQGQLRWSFKTGNWVDASPALGKNGTVYFGSWDKKFYALNLDGTQQWEFATGGPVVSSAAIDRKGVIYFGSHDRKFYALHPDGTKKWEFATEGAVLSSPAIGAEGTLYFTSADGYLWALNPDGTLRWKLHTGGINACSPVVGVHETIFLGINSNHCAVSAAGKLLWANHLSPQGYAPFDWVGAAPVALADGAAITSGTDSLLCIYEQPGWSWHAALGTGIRASPVITTDGRVYCVTDRTGLHAFANFPGPASSSWPMFRANAQRTGRSHTQ
ncbi:MAG: PQQ-binding-like beta-propeller repeat protein [Verrucomicrobiota bacterium]